MLKPAWLQKKIQLGTCHKTKEILRNLRLYTVCEQAQCPNISECFSRNIATFMILGNICTRNCGFCAVRKQAPIAPDLDEPRRIGEAVKKLNLSYVVITSPTRDDLPDGGAGHFCRTREQILSINPKVKIELLIPDFNGNEEAIKMVSLTRASVIGHNLETTPSLYIKVRKGADYNLSLSVLARIKKFNNDIFTKSGLMLGLGEEEKEVLQVLRDLREVDCDFLTLGQYLPPSKRHSALREYISPDKFTFFKNEAKKIGFKKVKSSPYVRSSYMAHSFFCQP